MGWLGKKKEAKARTETADEMETRLSKGYGEYSARERAAGREPMPDYRWKEEQLDREAKGEVSTEKPMTKREAKQPAQQAGTKTRMDYIKYRKRELDAGRIPQSFGQWAR